MVLERAVVLELVEEQGLVVVLEVILMFEMVEVEELLEYEQ